MIPVELDGAAWAERNFGGCELGNVRRTRRLVAYVADVARDPAASTPDQTESWSDCKAAYRLFDEEDVTFDRIAELHWRATREHVAAAGGWLLIGDTTQIEYGLGRAVTGLGPTGDDGGEGFFLHTSLVVHPETGAVAGLAGADLFHRRHAPAGVAMGPLAAAAGVRGVGPGDRPRGIAAGGDAVRARAGRGGRQLRGLRAPRAAGLRVGRSRGPETPSRAGRGGPLGQTRRTPGGRRTGRDVRLGDPAPPPPTGTHRAAREGGDAGSAKRHTARPRVRRRSECPRTWRRGRRRDRDVGRRGPRGRPARGRRAAPLGAAHVGPRSGLRRRVAGGRLVRTTAARRGVPPMPEDRPPRRGPAVRHQRPAGTRDRPAERRRRPPAATEVPGPHRPRPPVADVVPADWRATLAQLRGVDPATIDTCGTFFRTLAMLGGFLGRRHDGNPGWLTTWRGLRKLTQTPFTTKPTPPRCG